MVALKGTASEPQETTCYGTRWLEERPIIFKTNRRKRFSGKASFEAGFGCTIADAGHRLVFSLSILREEVCPHRSRRAH